MPVRPTLTCRLLRDADLRVFKQHTNVGEAFHQNQDIFSRLDFPQETWPQDNDLQRSAFHFQTHYLLITTTECADPFMISAHVRVSDNVTFLATSAQFGTLQVFCCPNGLVHANRKCHFPQKLFPAFSKLISLHLNTGPQELFVHKLLSKPRNYS